MKWGLAVAAVAAGVVLAWPWYRCPACGRAVWMPGGGYERHMMGHVHAQAKAMVGSLRVMTGGCDRAAGDR